MISTPTFFNALEYLFKSTPSSRVSPNVTPWKREKMVFKELPISVADCLVLAVKVVNAAVA